MHDIICHSQDDYLLILSLFRITEVNRHDSESNGVWVVFGEGVYDITHFIPDHPGAKNILMAAGGAVEPFWNLYAVHKVYIYNQSLKKTFHLNFTLFCISSKQKPYKIISLFQVGIILILKKDCCISIIKSKSLKNSEVKAKELDFNK
jgi:hypothetical protein